jgi:hypothetical protein
MRIRATANHRYLMSRLSLQVFYLWRHVLLTAPPFILWWSNLKILFAPLHRNSPFIGGLRCQAIQMEHGPIHSRKNPKSSLYCEVSMMLIHVMVWIILNNLEISKKRTIGHSFDKIQKEKCTNAQDGPRSEFFCCFVFN